MGNQLADRLEQISWQAGPRPLSVGKFVGALREMFAVRVDGQAVLAALKGDGRFVAVGDGFRLNIPDATWTALHFSYL